MKVRRRWKTLSSRKECFQRRDPEAQDSTVCCPTANQQTLISAVLNCRLVRCLRDNVLVLWLCEMVSGVVYWAASCLGSKPWTIFLLLSVIVCVLLLWLLCDFHFGVPCFFFTMFYLIYDSPLRTALTQAWRQWRTGQ